jgi:hypothetical protein
MTDEPRADRHIAAFLARQTLNASRPVIHARRRA